LIFRSPGPTLLQLGFLSLRWFAVITALAMALGVWLSYRTARRAGLRPIEMVTAAELALIGGLVGARLLYVLVAWDQYRNAPWRIVALWEGGLVFHGGLIGGVLVGCAYVAGKGLPVGPYLDAAAPALALGHAVGPWGTFFNEEAFGVPTNLPWRLYVSPDRRPLRFAADDYFHPSFLYESAWELVVFVVLMWWLRPRLAGAPGSLFLAYVGLYSFGLWWLELLRAEPLMLGPVRIAQLASIVGVSVAVIGIKLLLRRARGA
jgi:phosphatidylglycerol:prolipoprotein diacylglycerol transferase